MTNETAPGSTPAPEALDEMVAGAKAAHASSTAESAAAAADDGHPLLPQLQAAEKERDELKEQLLRTLAETENVRKRANKQVADEKIYAVERFARDLLAVSDYLAKAQEALGPEARANLSAEMRTMIEGVELTQKELHAVLARHGVKAVDAGPGAAFDPNTHQAVAQIPSTQPAGAVAELFQAGWKLGDRVLRPAMVAVSLGPKVS